MGIKRFHDMKKCSLLPNVNACIRVVSDCTITYVQHIVDACVLVQDQVPLEVALRSVDLVLIEIN